jgi:predicted DNA binding CopG/RHH family protein
VKSDKTEMTKTTLRVPKHLLDGCKHRAIDEGRNLQDVVTDALEAYLKTKTKSTKGKR